MSDGTSVSQLSGNMQQMTPQQQQVMQQQMAQQQAMQHQAAMAQQQQAMQQQMAQQQAMQQQMAQQQAMQQQMMENNGDDEVNDILHDLQQQHSGAPNNQMNEGFTNMGVNGVQTPSTKALPSNVNEVVEIIKEPYQYQHFNVILNLSFIDELLPRHLGSFLGEDGASSIRGVLLKSY